MQGKWQDKETGMSEAPTTPAPRRRSHWPLYVSVLLLLLFGALVAHQVFAKKVHVVTDEELLRQLAEAEFIEDPVPAGSHTQDWPQWRGQKRDGVAWTGPLQTQWPKTGLERLWNRTGAEAGESYSSFAVTGGRFYTQMTSEAKDKQIILCLNADTGEEIWSESYDRPRAKIEYGNWPRSTPVVDGDQVFTVDQVGRLQCRKSATGALLWEQDLLRKYGNRLPKWGVAFSPLVLGNLVYTNPGGPYGQSIVAFDRKTGAEVWKALDDPPSYSSPIAINVEGMQQVVFFTGAGLVGLTAKDGRLLWRFPWKTFSDVNATTPLAFRAKSGNKEHQYVFISSGYDKGCALLRIDIDNDGGFSARRVFESNQMCCHFSSPVRYKDHVYGFNESRLSCMSLRTGDVPENWPQLGYKKGSLLLAEPTKGKPMLVVLSEEGKLALVEATPDEFRLKSEVRKIFTLPRRCWPMPVLAEGKLYLRDEHEILCLKMPQEE